MNRPTRRASPSWLQALVLAATLTLAGIAPAAAPDDTDPLLLNLRDAEIGALIGTVAEITGRNFVVDPRVKGKVTVIGSAPVSADQLYDLFVTVLEVNGFAAIDDGDTIKVIPDVTSKFHSPPTDTAAAGGHEPASAVLALRHVNATELVPILRPLLPQEAHLAAHLASNSLIVSDTSTGIRRLQSLLGRIDQPGERSVDVVRLENASAPDLVQTLTGMIQAVGQNTKGRHTAASLTADPRTNSILITGDGEFRLEMRTLISHLDTPLENAGDTRVMYLHYAEADDLVPILQSLSGQPGDGRENTEAQGTVQIQADPSVNALIFKGQPGQVRELIAVVEQLDVRRAQVLVEAIIAEVTDDNATELGVQWRTAEAEDGIAAGSVFPSLSGPTIDGFDQTSLGPGLSLGWLRNQTIRGLVRLLRDQALTNVLSTPSLLTLDNEEAEIVVGQNVPFVTGQFTNDATTPDNPFQTVERQDVGIVLRLRPQINEGDAVRLDIEQEVSSVVIGTVGAGLTTNKRSIKTNILVDDGQIIVIGGLIEDDLQETTQKVPLLGDLPLLGRAFRSRRTDHIKTNLMVFLRPQIVRDGRHGSHLTQRKYNLIRGEQLGQKQTSGSIGIERRSRVLEPYPAPGDVPSTAPHGNAAGADWPGQD